MRGELVRCCGERGAPGCDDIGSEHDPNDIAPDVVATSVGYLDARAAAAGRQTSAPKQGVSELDHGAPSHRVIGGERFHHSIVCSSDGGTDERSDGPAGHRCARSRPLSEAGRCGHVGRDEGSARHRGGRSSSARGRPQPLQEDGGRGRPEVECGSGVGFRLGARRRPGVTPRTDTRAAGTADRRAVRRRALRRRAIGRRADPPRAIRERAVGQRAA